MIKNNLLEKVKQTGIAISLLLYPLFAGFAFAVHPDLLSLAIGHDVLKKIDEFHGNTILHFGHFLMLLGVPLLIVIALHFMNKLENDKPWLGWLGGILAIGGAVVLAADKAALCLVPSALDMLPEAQFQQMVPGIEAMFHYQGGLWVLNLLPILPLGFILQSIGLVSSNVLDRKISVPILIGSILMFNPDIDIIGFVATVFLAIGFFPYAIQIIRKTVFEKSSEVL